MAGTRALAFPAVSTTWPSAVLGCRVAGQLKVCSLSLYFVPRDIQEPVFRVPYKTTTLLEE